MRALLVGVVLALLATACTDGGDDGAASTSSTIPPARTLLRVGTTEWPECLNPIVCADDALNTQILQHVLPKLMEIGEAGEYVPSPLLAGPPEVEVLDDGRMTVTVALDPEANWSDGSPVTSSDVRGTWLAVMSTPDADRRGYDLIDGVDDADPDVAVLTFRQPYAGWPELFGGVDDHVLQADAFGGALDLSDAFRDELPFSAGPFRLAAWDRDVAVLAAVDEHWDVERAPAIDQVRLERRAEDDDPAGGFDVLLGHRGELPDGFDRRSVPTTQILGIWLDQRTNVLAAKPVRDAIEVAIDRAELAALAAGTDSVDPVGCLGWLPDVGEWCDQSDRPAAEQDRALAAFALTLDGWERGEDGVLRRGEEPLALTVTHDPAVPRAGRVAQLLAEQLEAIGVAVSTTEIATEDWRSDRTADRSTGVGVHAFDVGVSPLVGALYGCPRGADSSVIGWCDPAVVAASSRLAATVDGSALDIARSIGDRAATELVWLPLVRIDETVAIRAGRVSLPGDRPPGIGPLGFLHDFEVDS